jgi:hypothetical protein
MDGELMQFVNLSAIAAEALKNAWEENYILSKLIPYLKTGHWSIPYKEYIALRQYQNGKMLSNEFIVALLEICKNEDFTEEKLVEITLAELTRIGILAG